MNIAVADDIPECTNRIKTLIEPYMEQNSISLSIFSSGEDLLASIDTGHEYEIMFLDIEMDGISGIDIARRLRTAHKDTIIIFITSHPDYVSETFRLDAFQFLLKPIDEAAFKIDFERALRTYHIRHKNYVVKWRDTSRVLEYSDIYYIEAYNRHLFIRTFSDKLECVGKLPDEYIKLKPYGFSRCHQGYLVSMGKIKHVTQNEILLANNETVPISRRLKSAFLNDFNLYLAGTKI